MEDSRFDLDIPVEEEEQAQSKAFTELAQKVVVMMEVG